MVDNREKVYIPTHNAPYNTTRGGTGTPRPYGPPHLLLWLEWGTLWWLKTTQLQPWTLGKYFRSCGRPFRSSGIHITGRSKPIIYLRIATKTERNRTWYQMTLCLPWISHIRPHCNGRPAQITNEASGYVKQQCPMYAHTIVSTPRVNIRGQINTTVPEKNKYGANWRNDIT